MASDKKPKKVKVEKLQEWSPIASPEVAYTGAMRASAHYSARTVHSTVGTGVRIAAEDFFDAPYLAVSTLLQDPVRKDRVPVDYIRSADPDSKLWKQIEAVRDPKQRARFESIPAAEEAVISAALPLLDERAEHGTQFVDARLRQVLLPTSESMAKENYVALTPLSAAGLSELVARRIETDRERRNATGEKPRYQRYAVLGHGGGNTQNVGRWTNAMNKALVFDAPTEKPEMRKAFAIYYKGLQLRTRLVRELNAYVYWHHQQASANHGVVAENLRTTSERIALLGAIARRALVIGEAAERHQFDVLVLDALAELTNSSVDSMERELIDSRLRIGAFGQRFARWIMRLVQTHQFELPGTVNKVVLGMADTEAVRLAGVIEGAWQ